MPAVAVVYYSAQSHTHELAVAVGEGAGGERGGAGVQNVRETNDGSVAKLTRPNPRAMTRGRIEARTVRG